MEGADFIVPVPLEYSPGNNVLVAFLALPVGVRDYIAWRIGALVNAPSTYATPGLHAKAQCGVIRDKGLENALRADLGLYVSGRLPVENINLCRDGGNA